MAEDDLLFPGFLYQNESDDPAANARGRYPYPYPYAYLQTYQPAAALRQGTLFPWLDDHWRQSIDAHKNK